ncbi:MAG: sensor histidine kinase [Actinomycetota bacterium]|nr:sensor histidine kinase [Actinomycetota bacterium]
MRLRMDPVRLDQLVAAVLLTGAELQVWLGGPADAARAAQAAVTAVIAGPVAVRRRYPTLVGFGVQGLMAAQSAFVQAISAGPPVIGIAWFCALYALAIWTSTRWFVAGMVFFAVTNLAPVEPGTVTDVGAFTVGGIVVMVLLRRIVRDRERQLQIAERERGLLAREAVVEERARIAREMHDVIAHHVSMMVLQAGAERRMLADEQAPTREVFGTIERSGRDALTEMRRLVGMLRGGAGDTLAPQPGIDDMPTLIEQMCSAGLPVELLLDGEPAALPVGLSLSAYRIVQEGLTNALKHGGGTACVRVSYGRDCLELMISDTGADHVSDTTGGGHGLVGIRERVALYGGTLDVGHQPVGGFGIRVLLPVR